MGSIDERIVSMKFDNKSFENGVAQTMASIDKLNASLAQIGLVTGFADINTAADKVTLEGPMSALDRLKARFGLAGDDATEGMAGVEQAGERVTLSGPMAALDRLKARFGLTGDDAAEGMAGIEQSADRVELSGPMSALDKLKARFGLTGDDAAAGMAGIEQAGDRVELSGPMSALDRLKAQFGSTGANAASEFEEINTAADKVTFAEMASGIDNISSKISVMGVVAFTAINEISKSLLEFGKKTVTGLLDPILGGGKDRAIKIEQAKFQFRGLGQDVEKSMDSALAAVKGTAYGLDAAASVAAQFGATGMKAGDEMTGALRGVAGMAAMTGTSYEEIGQIFTTVAGEGKLSTMRMQQFATRGVNVAAQLAKQMGKSENEIRQMVRDGEISFKDFAKYMDEAFGEHATKANETYSGSLANVKAALSRVGASLQAPRLEAMRKIFNALTDVIDKFAEALEPAIEQYTKFTEISSDRVVEFLKSFNFDRLTKALPAVIQGVKNVFTSLLAIIKPIGQAFRDIFPPKTGEAWTNAANSFQAFTSKLIPSKKTAENLKRTFRGLFAVVHIGITIIGKIVQMFGKLLGASGQGAGGILNFTGSIGDFLVSVDKALTKGGLLTAFFDILTNVLSAPIKLLGAIGDAIFGLFDGADSSKVDKFGNSMSDLSDKLKPTGKAFDGLGKAWDKLKKLLQPALDEIGKALSGFGDIVASAFSADNIDTTLEFIQTGLIASLVGALKKALGADMGIDFGGGFLGQLSEMFKVLSGNLMAMQQNLKAKTLLSIAMAIGVLAAGVLVLSTIEPAALAKAMSAVVVGLGQLVAVMLLLAKTTAGKGFVGVTASAAALILLATAVTILSVAVTIFSKLSWNELVKGLVGVGGALVAVALGTKMLGPSLVLTAAGLIPLAIGMNLLAVAVMQFGNLSWEELVKGLVGSAGAIVGIGLAIRLMPPSIILIGPALIALAFAMNLLAVAVFAFGSMDLLTLGKGILGIAAALVAIGLAITVMPPTLALQAAGLLLVSIALTSMAAAIGAMGSLDILTLVKGIAALGAVLVVLGIGLTAMSGTLAGSAALLAAAAALAVIAPVLGFLGQLEIGTIVKGLAAIAAVLGILAIAGLVASAPLAALGIAMLPLAAVMVVTASAAYIFAEALQVMGGEGTKGIGVMVAAITAFIALLPAMLLGFVKGLVDIIAQIAIVAPQVTESLVKIITAMVGVIVKAAPQLLIAISTLIGLFVVAVVENGPKIIAAGFLLLVSFLSGLANNIGKVTTLGVKVVLEFLKAITKDIGKLVTAGAKFLVEFLGGIAKNMSKVVGAASNVVVKFLKAVASHTSKIISAGFDILIAFIKGIVDGFARVITTGIKLIGEFIVGINRGIPDLIEKAVEVVGTVIKSMAEGLVKLADVGAEAIIDFMNGMADTIREKAPRIREAGANLAGALISGMTFGLSDKVRPLFAKIREIVGKIPKAVRKLLGIRSPSKVFSEIGHQTMDGLTKGIFDGGSDTEQAMETSGNQVVKMAKRTMGNLGDILDGVIDLDPVIAPVLDLSAVHKEAGNLKYLNDSITAAASFNQASAISQEKTASETAQAAEAAQAGPSFNFEQNNYSPESLTDIEIYRRTNNQLSQVKSAIGLVP
jgi:tape measure domain-containing protein